MGNYHACWRNVPSLPDGRLAVVDPSGRTASGLPILRTDILTGHVKSGLFADLTEMFRHTSRSIPASIEPDRKDDPADWVVWHELIDPELLPLRTFAMRTGTTQDGRKFFVCIARSDMMTKELCKELNDYTIPENLGLIRDLTRQPPGPGLDHHLQLAVNL